MGKAIVYKADPTQMLRGRTKRRDTKDGHIGIVKRVEDRHV